MFSHEDSEAAKIVRWQNQGKKHVENILSKCRKVKKELQRKLCEHKDTLVREEARDNGEDDGEEARDDDAEESASTDCEQPDCNEAYWQNEARQKKRAQKQGIILVGKRPRRASSQLNHHSEPHHSEPPWWAKPCDDLL